MKKNVLLFSVLILFQSSCIVSYYQVKTKVPVKPNKKLVVVAGMFDHNTKVFAQLLTKKLRKKTRFTVIPQSLLKKRNAHYPVRIKGPYRGAYFEIDENWTLSDKQKIIRLAKSVNSDYAYVVWIPIDGDVDDNLYQCEAIGQMFDVKTGEEIGNSKYPLTWVKGAYIGYGAHRTRKTAFEKSADKVVHVIASKMNMERHNSR